MNAYVRVGGYEGPAIIGGHDAEVLLSATRRLASVGRGGTVPGAIHWRGTATILDPQADLLELMGSVELTIGDRIGNAVVVLADLRGGPVRLTGSGEPPFDIDPIT